MAMKAKDGVMVSLYLRRDIKERLASYSQAHGQTMTAAVERILEDYFDKADSQITKGTEKK